MCSISSHIQATIQYKKTARLESSEFINCHEIPDSSSFPILYFLNSFLISLLILLLDCHHFLNHFLSTTFLSPNLTSQLILLPLLVLSTLVAPHGSKNSAVDDARIGGNYYIIQTRHWVLPKLRLQSSYTHHLTVQKEVLLLKEQSHNQLSPSWEQL